MAPVGRCNYHGLTGIAFTCLHICGNVQERKESEKIISAGFPDEFGVFELFYCPACALEYALPVEHSETPFEDKTFDEMYAKLLGSNCYKCLMELNPALEALTSRRFREWKSKSKLFCRPHF